jgi:hypothetical protein
MSSLPESLVRFRRELEDAIRRELEAQATARSNGWGARVLRAVRRRPGRTTLALAAVAGAAAAALFFGTPWKTSPGFLEEVQAALTPEGSILHMRWEDIQSSSDLDPACTVTYGPNEIWIDETPPHRYRALLIGPYVEIARSDYGSTDPRALACPDGPAAEIGGTDTEETLRFEPPNTLRRITRFAPQLDPVEDLRTRLSSGRAHEEGTTQLDGRTVERIRLDPPSECPGSFCKPAYAYVDPETFYPIQIEYEGWGSIFYDGSRHPTDLVTRFLTYEPLPRTAANVALTDIRAQHPDATAPDLHPPKLTGAVTKTVRAAKGAKSARVTFEVTATADGRDIPVSCEPPSGSRFPLGRTTVRCWSSDSSRNTAFASFTVTVIPRR